jgi:hypothetical protein
LDLARYRPHLLVAVALAMVAALALHGPIPQDPAYHHFSDTRALLGVPNFWNVLSNLPFLLVGVAGVRWVLQAMPGLPRALRQSYLVLFLGVALVGLGSAWYHLQPSNDALLWDRLPMTLAFTALFSIILGEHLAPRLGPRLLWPMLLAGVLSVLYWHATERAGVGDLRPYAVVQFLPVLLIPMILVLYPRPGSAGLWLALGAYVVAKVLEQFDARVADVLHGAISGHSLKHVVAALGMWALLAGLQRRASSPGIAKT